MEGLHERLVHLGATGARSAEVGNANDRLKALSRPTTDSHKVLTELLAAWPDQVEDPLRAVVQGAPALLDALAKLDDGARAHLEKGRSHPTVGAAVAAHLDELVAALAMASAERPVTGEWIGGWNRRSQELIASMIATHGTVEVTLGAVTAKGTGAIGPSPQPPDAGRVVYAETVNLAAKAAIPNLVAAIRGALEGRRGRVRVTITREDD